MTISNRAAILMEIATEAQTNPEYWKEFQYYSMNFRWDAFEDEEDLLDALSSSLEIRRKLFVKPTRKIGEYDAPYPVQEPLQSGETYFTLDLAVVFRTYWDGSGADLRRLKNGLIFKDQDDAECVQKALLSLTRVTGE